MPENRALSQNVAFLADRRWTVWVPVCVKLASAMQVNFRATGSVLGMKSLLEVGVGEPSDAP